MFKPFVNGYNMDSSGRIQVKKPSGFLIIGRNYCLLYNGEIYATVGPDWGFNVCILLFILIAVVFFIFAMAPKVEPMFQYLGLFIYLSALITYLLTALKNPGIILNPWEIELEDIHQSPESLCKVCRVPLEAGSEHCPDCQVCIRQHDHHCPLSGKCIGAGNTIPFHSFLLFVFLSFVYFGVWMFYRSKSEVENK